MFLLIFSGFYVVFWQLYVALPLYVRGFAMGLIFSPLTTVAISEIANRDMAQASGLFNVIRQIGGSFGVAAFGTVFLRRAIYHAATYGEQVNPYSEAFREAARRLGLFAAHATGGTAAEATEKARALVGTFVGQQAFVQAVDDVFLLATVVIVVAIIPVLLLRPHHGRVAGGAGAVD